MTVWRRPKEEHVAEFEKFVSARYSALRRLSSSLASDQAHAEDLLQETLTRTLEHWQRVVRADAPYAYVRRIMVTTKARFWRLHGREIPFPFRHADGEDSMPDGLICDLVQDEFELLEERGVLTQALRRLPIRQRTVLVLRYLEDLPDDEIAHVLDISTVTVRTTAMRGARNLQKLIPDFTRSVVLP